MAATLNYMSLDISDVKYPAKEVCANPTRGSWRLGLGEGSRKKIDEPRYDEEERHANTKPLNFLGAIVDVESPAHWSASGEKAHVDL